MSTDHEPSAGEKASPATASGERTDVHRRAALRKLGRVGAYAVPITISLMTLQRAAVASP